MDIESRKRRSKEKKMNKDYKHGDRVRYIPNHAEGNLSHSSCQDGVVSSINESWVFVKYNCLACTMITGDEPYTAQATDRRNLVRLPI